MHANPIATRDLLIEGRWNHQLQPFNDTGVLARGGPGVRFHADNGGIYHLDVLGPFHAGDRIQVTGILSRGTTRDQQVDGTIHRCMLVAVEQAIAITGCVTVVSELPVLAGDDGMRYLLNWTGVVRSEIRVRAIGTRTSLAPSIFPNADGCLLATSVVMLEA